MAITSGSERGYDTQVQEEEDIPAYQSIAPSIFVPAQIDFTKPLPRPPSEPTQRRVEMLAQIDEHADAVLENIYYMLNREKTRILQECKRREANFPHHRDLPGLTDGEERSLPSNGMEMDEILYLKQNAPKPNQISSDVPPMFTHNQCLHVETGGPEETPRKSAEKMLMNLVKHGIQNLEGFAQHIENVKEVKRRELDNETHSKGQTSTENVPADRMDIS
ncbi:uncharacterized protein F4812DRAFT_197701 [Daldinia caldariorum]|uniref:uncharacterized protein n=1 Tax=Daldinia caldariorum TaxID=326644 RepID=UPI0020078FD6|nr:uncharacterized protein F4812DRAFT_197701 [Daldinia caldariorum]KAI1471885.1 hypothetical protein F4812DRAFT_197701 [Daldinia caldariorum]